MGRLPQLGKDMNKKKLAILTPGFYEQAIGGAEYQTYLLSMYAMKFDWDVHHIYIALKEPSDVPNYLGIKLHPIYPRRSKWLRKLGRYEYLISLFKIWKYLRQIKPDIVYCRSGVPQVGLGAYYSKRYKVKSIWQIASFRDVDPRWNSFRPFDFISKKCLEYGIRNSKLILAQANYQQIFLKQNYHRTAEIFKNLLPEAKEILNKCDTILKVVWIANIKPLKRLDLFVELAKSLENFNDIELFIIGKNQSYGKIDVEGLIKGIRNLHYLGEKEMDEVNEILAESHILVNTSSVEGFSNAFIQAWMREVVVCSLNVDPDNLLTDAGMGFCCYDVDKLKEVILKLHTNIALRHEIVSRAKCYAMQNHSLEKNSYRIKNLILNDQF